MPNLAKFSEFALKTGLVPQIEGNKKARGNKASEQITVISQCLAGPVPHVPPVPRQNDTSTYETDWLAQFDERAGILEFDGGLNRTEAERRALSETTALLGPRPGRR